MIENHNIQKQKTAIITFLGNAYHDSRVVNLIDSLNQVNIDTTTISFDWKTKDFKTQLGKTAVYKLDKSKSSLAYYFNFIFILIRELFKKKTDIYFAEDIYTLPFVYFFAKLNKGKVFYNSREIYAHLAGLRNKSFVQKIIAKIESGFIRKVDTVLVTGDMDAEYLKESYGINNLFVLRNLPKYKTDFSIVDLHEKFNIPKNNKIILYQGVVLEGRGILKVIDLITEIDSVHFVIVGEGEFRQKFENYVNILDYKDRIHFIGAVNHSELLNYTAGADLGLALIENISISYYYALPNKLFEYIMAGVPVLASNLPQMKKVIDEHKVGKYVNMDDDDEIKDTLKNILSDQTQLKEFKAHCESAAKILNWENEFESFKKLL